MASYNIAAGAVSSGKKTLIAADPTSFTFADNVGAIRIISDGSAEIYLSLNTATAPTVDGVDCRMIPAGVLSVIEVESTNVQTGDVVRMISAGTPTVRVERV